MTPRTVSAWQYRLATAGVTFSGSLRTVACYGSATRLSPGRTGRTLRGMTGRPPAAQHVLLLWDEQAQNLALQEGDTRRHVMTHPTGNSSAGYSTYKSEFLQYTLS